MFDIVVVGFMTLGKIYNLLAVILLQKSWQDLASRQSPSPPEDVKWIPRWKEKTKQRCCVKGCTNKGKAIMGRFLTSEKADLMDTHTHAHIELHYLYTLQAITFCRL